VEMTATISWATTARSFIPERLSPIRVSYTAPFQSPRRPAALKS